MARSNNDRPVAFRIRLHWWKLITPVAGLVLVTLAGTGIEAHKGITSKYKYNDQVFPILRDRCGRCHVEGGHTPMSFMTYSEAVPWAESIREKLVGEAMPPWYADPNGPAVKGGYGLSTQELDVLVTWAAGGTPRSTESTFMGVGAPNGSDPTDPPPFRPNLARWKLGPPDLVIKMEAECTLPVGTPEEIRELTLPTGLTTDKWIKALDLLPGTPSMVRDAVISIENGPVLAAWVAGDDIVPAPSGAAFRLPAGAKLHLHIHYKKHWQDEGEPKSDRSTIGLYFTDPPLSGRELETLSLSAPEAASNSPSPRKFDGTFKSAARVVAIRPSFDQAYARVAIEAVLPSGRRVELLRLRAPQPQWYRRYWLVEPIELPESSKVEITAVPALPDRLAVPAPRRYPLQVDVDFVAQ